MLEADSTWYQDAVIYQVHVRSYFDSDSDGIGDFRGLTQKLDYLQDLGVTAIWVLPFYPSPLRDEGYDIADYRGVHPDYGTMRQFRELLRQAHKRGLRVITELVINHTSDQHPWFQRARSSPPGSKWRDFYVWSDTPDRYMDARIIFQDFEPSNWSWDHQAGAYYWHRFYSHQPDLNFENPAVHDAVVRTLDHWLEMGVDGMRLDAVPYLYEEEGTNCENLPPTHEFLKKLRAHIDERFDDKMLLAEANQWPEDASAYFGDGDECHMNFHFPLMPRLFMANRMEDRFPIIDILQQTPEIPKGCQWAVFLRNHDELTLEMVTDEERDYMYRAYARDRQARVNLGIRRRLAPLLGNHRAKIELMNGLLMSLPGTPIVYYGDEIGMGDNIYLGDRNGVRTPMQWSADRNAGFSRANPQKLFLPPVIDPEYHYETVNVEAQLDNPHSLLRWMKRLIALRRRHPVFGRGELTFLHPENPKVLAFIRHDDDDRILVVANLSRFAQYVELDLAEFKGTIPVELFGHTEFPRIGDLPYLLTLGPHNFLWMSLTGPREEAGLTRIEHEPVTISVSNRFDEVVRPKTKARAALEASLPAFLATRRWFGGKTRKIQSTALRDVVGMRREGGDAHIAFVDVDYADGEPETYVLPMVIATPPYADLIREDLPGTVVAHLHRRDDTAVLFDATVDPAFAAALLDTIRSRRRPKGAGSRAGAATALVGHPFAALRRLLDDDADLTPSLNRAEQSNSSIAFGDRLFLKLFRKLEQGENPDLELGRHLSEQAAFAHVPLVAGAIEARRGKEDPATLAVLYEQVANEGDAWRHALDHVSRYYERVLAERDHGQPSPPTPRLLDLAREEALDDQLEDLVGAYLDTAELLGERTAELHAALAGEGDFRPEPFSTLYQRSLYQSMRNLTRTSFQTLKRRIRHLSDADQELATRLLDAEGPLLDKCRALLDGKISARRIRVHGDLHLGQVLWTGKDFVFIDFEGEPARPLGERRLKRSPLRDVAGLVRSYDYAAHAGLVDLVDRGIVTEREVDELAPATRSWSRAAASRFVRSYCEHASGAGLLPDDPDDLALLFDVFLVEKAVYELGYELGSRPDWVGIPLRGILEVLDL